MQAIAFLPVAPGLLPAISRGAEGDLAGVRAACAAALDRVIVAGLPVVVVGPKAAAGSVGSAQGFGVDLDWRIGPSDGRLPWEQAVGAWFLAERGLPAVATGPVVPSEECVVLAMGDGSICRSTQAPGFLDDRAEGWDATVAAGLTAGSLTGIDWELGTELQAAGVPVWKALAAVDGPWETVLHADEAPQGVGLLVASWFRR